MDPDGRNTCKFYADFAFFSFVASLILSAGQLAVGGNSKNALLGLLFVSVSFVCRFFLIADVLFLFVVGVPALFMSLCLLSGLLLSILMITVKSFLRGLFLMFVCFFVCWLVCVVFPEFSVLVISLLSCCLLFRLVALSRCVFMFVWLFSINLIFLFLGFAIVLLAGKLRFRFWFPVRVFFHELVVLYCFCFSLHLQAQRAFTTGWRFDSKLVDHRIYGCGVCDFVFLFCFVSFLLIVFCCVI